MAHGPLMKSTGLNRVKNKNKLLFAVIFLFFFFLHSVNKTAAYNAHGNL